MTVAAIAQGLVSGLAERIALRGNASPQVDDVAQPPVRGEAARDDTALAGLSGDRCHAAQAAPRVIVAPPQGVVRLCQQRGADYRTDSGQGSQDGHVTLLFWLPRRWLLGIALRRAELVEERVELRARLGELLVDHDEAFREQPHVHLCDARRGRIDGQRALLQLAFQRGAVEAPDTVFFQQLVVGRHAHAARGRRGRHALPQVQCPGLGEICHGVVELRVAAPQLLAHLVAEPHALALELLGDARPLAQFDDERIGRFHLVEGVRIAAQRRRQHPRVAAVILRTGWRVAIAEPVQLLGIDRVHRQAVRQQALHDRPARRLDRHADCLPRCIRGAVRDARHHLRQARTAMRERTFLANPSRTVEDAHVVRARSPVHPNEPLQLCHVASL